MNAVTQKSLKLLRWSQKYTKTDMVYLASGGFWLLFGKGVVFIVSFLTTLAFANWLPKESFGTYQYILALLGLSRILALPGMHSALVRSIAQRKEGTLALAVKTKLKWSILGTLTMLTGSAWYFLHGQIVLATALLLAGLFLPLYTTFPIFDAYWNGKKRFDKKSKYEIAVTVFVALWVIPTIYLTNNIVIILLVLFSSSILIGGFILWETLKQAENTDKDEKSVSFGKHITAINGIAVVAGQIDKVILWKLLGPVQLALYTFALLPIQKVFTFNPIGTLALPKISENGIQRNLWKKMAIGFAVTVPAAVGLAVLAPFIYDLLFPQYTESVIYFQVLSILIAVAPLHLLHIVLVAEARKKELYISNIASSVAKIVLFLILMPSLGIWGAVLGLLGGEAVGNVLRLYFFIKMTSAPKAVL